MREWVAEERALSSGFLSAAQISLVEKSVAEWGHAKANLIVVQAC